MATFGKPGPGNASPIRKKRKRLGWILAFILLAIFAAVRIWIFPPVSLHWKDRRPVGILFLASNFHASKTNPRGWFNNPLLDVIGTNGTENFRNALMEYTDRSISILKRTGAQGVIVWDVEGEQYPHKTTFIGDPRLVDRLAPEMAPVADEFFARLRNAGFRVGVTVRPQQLVFDPSALPHQTEVLNTRALLRDKIDYATKRWGTTLYYVDSTGGIRRPDEAWQMRCLAEERPDVLLIPEHYYLPYWAFSAPYETLRGNPAASSHEKQKLFPGTFRALEIDDAGAPPERIAAASLRGDILLYRAWGWSPECQLLENLASARPR